MKTLYSPRTGKTYRADTSISCKACEFYKDHKQKCPAEVGLMNEFCSEYFNTKTLNRGLVSIVAYTKHLKRVDHAKNPS